MADGVFDFPLLEEKVTAVAQDAVLSVLEGKSFQQAKVMQLSPRSAAFSSCTSLSCPSMPALSLVLHAMPAQGCRVDKPGDGERDICAHRSQPELQVRGQLRDR